MLPPPTKHASSLARGACGLAASDATAQVASGCGADARMCAAADGDEGGRHQLITAAVSGGVLYILKIQVGDKRWFKGVDRDAKGTWNSFTVA